MRIVTATEAARDLAELLDAVERGEIVLVTRAGRTVASIAPAVACTGRSLRAALDAAPRLDDAFEVDVAAALRLLAAGPAAGG